MSKRLYNGCNVVPYDTNKPFKCCKCGFTNIDEEENIKVKTKRLTEEINEQRDLITKKLNSEFNDLDTARIWEEINELIDLELNFEKECNQ